MPIWIMLIPELIKLIFEIWKLLRKKPEGVGQQVRSEVNEIFKECPDAQTCKVSRRRLVERLTLIRDRLKQDEA